MSSTRHNPDEDSGKAPIPPQAASGKDLCIKVMGIGGAGCTMVHYMLEQKEQPGNITYLCLHTNEQTLRDSSAHGTIVLGTSGLSTQGNVVLGRKKAEMSRTQIREALEGCDMLVMLAGLGGGTSSSTMPLCVRLASEMKVRHFAIVTVPMPREDAVCRNNATQALQQLQGPVDSLFVIESGTLLKMEEHLTQEEIWERVHSVVFELICRLTKDASELIDNLAHLPKALQGLAKSHQEDVAQRLAAKVISKARGQKE